MCACLTVDVVDGEPVGEVGHVGLLSEGSLLLRGALRATVIQTLGEEEETDLLFLCLIKSETFYCTKAKPRRMKMCYSPV